MEELRKFQSSTLDTTARRKLVEDQNTILELIGRVQELQNEVHCMNDSKDFQDAESFRSGNSHVTSQPMLFPVHPIPEGMLRPLFVSPSRREGPPRVAEISEVWSHIVSRCQFLARTGRLDILVDRELCGRSPSMRQGTGKTYQLCPSELQTICCPLATKAGESK